MTAWVIVSAFSGDSAVAVTMMAFAVLDGVTTRDWRSPSRVTSGTVLTTPVSTSSDLAKSARCDV